MDTHEAVLTVLSISVVALFAIILSAGQYGELGDQKGLAAAKYSSPCGNNRIDYDLGEQCDRRQFGGVTCQSLGFDRGTLLCFPPRNARECTYDTSRCIMPAVCGNNILETGEDCDGSKWGSISGCADLGFDGGTLTCNTNTCKFDASRCGNTAPYCGDGIRNDPVEMCDGNDLGGLTCQDFGLNGGTISCNTFCEFDISGCYASVAYDDQRYADGQQYN